MPRPQLLAQLLVAAVVGLASAQPAAPATDPAQALALRYSPVVRTEKAAYLRTYPWLGFIGHWGEQHSGFYNGPTGPNTKLQWTGPIAWANESFRDKSFVVPAGGAVGSTATGFFCDAVATGSSLLTAITGNPSPC